MATINLYFQLVGVAPTEWFDTPVKRDGHIWVQGQPQRKSVATGDGLFMQQLAEMVGKMFQETLQSGRSMFDTATCSSQSVSARGQIGSRDLLCYVCDTRVHSIIKQFNKSGYDAAVATLHNASPNATHDGLTDPMPGGGICSEVYMDQNGVNIRVQANNIYHEFMHNKTNWAAGENPNWVHNLDGLAQLGNSGLAGLTPRVMQGMLQHIANANAQYIAPVASP